MHRLDQQDGKELKFLVDKVVKIEVCDSSRTDLWYKIFMTHLTG